MADKITYEPSPCQHEPFDFCMSHYRCEPMTESTYTVCGECGHAFDTADDLLRDHNAVLVELGIDRIDTDPEKVWVCPHCTHDF